MNKYIRFPGFREKTVTFSYDDGVRQDKRLVEIMKRNGLRGTFNICGGLFPEASDGKDTGRMTSEEARELYIPSGMEVAIHGYRHLSLVDVPTPLAINDIHSDRCALEALFGRVLDGMAYANGAYNCETVDILKKDGIAYARTTESTETLAMPSDWLRWNPTCHHANPRLMDLARELVEAKTEGYYWARARDLKLLYVWGHSYEFDNGSGWEDFEKFAEYIGGREDVWYATNGEIYDYMRAAESLRFSADGALVRNDTSLDIYLSFSGRRVLVPAGTSVKTN